MSDKYDANKRMYDMQKVLNELRDVPEKKKKKYWLDNMPMIVEEDKKMFPLTFMYDMVYQYRLIFHRVKRPSNIEIVLAILTVGGFIYAFSYFIGG